MIRRAKLASDSPDRRSEERHVTVLMIGRVDGRACQQACIIRNMSPRGLMARFVDAPAVGEQVVVQCRTLPATVATVRWRDGDVAGLELLHSLPVERIGARDPTRYVARAPRFGAAFAAKLQQGSQGQIGRLVNISAGGACVEGGMAVEPGAALSLILPHLLAATPARTIWQADQRMGLRFNTPLGFEALTRIVQGTPTSDNEHTISD